jgi:hypothetical protein
MSQETWYLLIHQIPARPLYLRARIRALLLRAGAVALKKAVYALPRREGGLERLQSVAGEIRRRGGEAFVCEARFPDAQDDATLLAAAREQRSADYHRLSDAAEALLTAIAAGAATGSGSQASVLRGRLAKLKKQLEWIGSVDFFVAEGRKNAEAVLRRLERRLAASRRPGAGEKAGPASKWVGHIWVTRRGVHVDRIACAWFIRRFLDPSARFRFVHEGQAGPRPGELRFDMPQGEFSHEGGRCSMETLIAKTGRGDSALERIAGIVHDIDLKDGRFGYPETVGIERLLGGILLAHAQDEARLERGGALFDDLYRSLGKPPKVALPKKATGAR